MNDQRYQIAAAARLTGLSTDVIRKWELRYGLVRPERDAGGGRSYTAADIARLRLARAATERGHAIRKVAALSDEALAALVDDARPADAVPATAAAALSAALDAVRAGDADRLQRTIFSSAFLVAPRELVLSVFVPLLREIGTLWEEGTVAIWQEHLLSEIVGVATAIMSRLGTPRRGRRSFLFATPPGEQHAFGIAFAAMLTAGAGFAAHNLGPNVPVSEVVAAATRLHVDCVVVAITASEIGTHPGRYLQALGMALPGEIDLWAGGGAATPAAGPLAGARVRMFPTLDAFADALDELR